MMREILTLAALLALSPSGALDDPLRSSIIIAGASAGKPALVHVTGTALDVNVVSSAAAKSDPLLGSTIIAGVSNGRPALLNVTGTALDVNVVSGGGGVPSGMIGLVVTGTCPTGWSEVTALNGVSLRGTLAANGDVGTATGADSATPTVASTNLTAAAQAFTGSSATSSAVSAGTPSGTNSTSTVTPLGTNSTSTVTPLGTVAAPVISWPAGVPTFSGSALATHAHELPWQIPSTTTIRQIAVAAFGTGTSRAATAVSAAGTANTTSAAVALSQAVTGGTPSGTIAWPAGVPTNTAPAFTGSSSTVGAQTFTGSSSTVGAQTFTGSALGTHQHTLTATGTNGTSAVTGTITMNSMATVPSSLKVIFCSKD